MSVRVTVTVPLTLRLDVPPLLRALTDPRSDMVKKHFQRTADRAIELGKYAATTWQSRISQLPDSKRPLRLGGGRPMIRFDRDAYEASIRIAPTEWEPNALSVTVYSADPQAELIEHGTPELDLHDVLPHAPKARRGADGKLYLRIPFRHNTESGEGGPVLPRAIVAVMKQKPKYLMIQGGDYFERSPNVKYGMVKRHQYLSIAGRLSAAEIAGVNQRHRTRYLLPPTHQGPPRPPLISKQYGDRLTGLMHTGGQTGGQQRHGGYLTIRTLSQANERGWRIPAYPPQHLLQQVADEVSRVAEGWFGDAIQADMAAMAESVGRGS